MQPFNKLEFFRNLLGLLAGGTDLPEFRPNTVGLEQTDFSQIARNGKCCSPEVVELRISTHLANNPNLGTDHDRISSFTTNVQPPELGHPTSSI